MATFKVGQRVKKVRGLNEPELFQAPHVPNGSEGVVIRDLKLARPVNKAEPGWFYLVIFDGRHSGFFDGSYSMAAEQLAPLTDPKTDAFIEAIRKMRPLHEEPKVSERQTVHTGSTAK